MRVRYDILDVSLFVIFYSYDPTMPWDVEGDAPKRETPVVREYIEEILAIRE